MRKREDGRIEVLYPEDEAAQNPEEFDRIIPLLACCYGCDRPVKHAVIQYSNDWWNTEFDGHVGFYCDEHVRETWDEDEQPFIDYTHYTVAEYRNQVAHRRWAVEAEAKIKARYSELPVPLVARLKWYSDEEIEQYVQARRNGDKYIVLRDERFWVF